MKRARFAEILTRLVDHESDGRTFRVLSLTALIDAKTHAGRPKDLAVLPVLRATLDEVGRRS